MIVNGRLHFFSETGTEGGIWTIQDAAQIHGEVDACPWGGEIELSDGRRACPGMRAYWDGDRQVPEPLEHWTYDGVVPLQTGDTLTVRDPATDTIVWNGEIEIRQLTPFTESEWGLWLRSRPVGVEDQASWTEMFLRELPAMLERSKE